MVVIGSDGVLAPGKWRWARAVGWLLALGATTIFFFNVVARVVRTLVGDGSQPLPSLLGAIGGCVAILLLYRFAVAFGERRAAPELALAGAPVDLLKGAAIGIGIMVLVIGIQWAAGWVKITPQPIGAIAIALRDSLRSGVVEELLLRLIIFRLLWRAFGIWPALCGAAMVFGALHLFNPDSSLFAAVSLAGGEGIAIGLYLITGRIWAPIAMHSAWNFTQGWIFGAIVSGTTEIAGGPLRLVPAPGVSAYLSGGGFGPEASIPALLASIAASVWLLRRAWTSGDFHPADAN